jgi:hypothetical protein
LADGRAHNRGADSTSKGRLFGDSGYHRGRLGAKDRPDGFIWNNAEHRILKVANTWVIHALWWEPSQTVWDEYLKVVTDTGMLCAIFRDLLRGGWFLARIYD